MEVALIGKGPGKELAPLKGKGVTTWGVNDIVGERECDVCFYMDRHLQEGWQVDETITASVNTTKTPLYTAQPADGVENNIIYPIEEVKKFFGTDYFVDSCCYMVALAIYQGFDHIRFYGFTYGWGSAYVEEKPGVVFWLGIALGRGLRVSIYGEHSALLKTPDNIMYAYQNPQEMTRVGIKCSDYKISTEDIEFNITDRVQLIGMLPKEGDYKTVKFSHYLRGNLLFDIEESKQLNFRNIKKTESGELHLIWDKNEIPAKMIKLTQAEKAIIACWLYDADSRGEITYDNMALFEKFCLGETK